MYSSHTDADPQSFRSRKISSVKVEPEDPIKIADLAHMVLSNMASTLLCMELRSEEFVNKMFVYWYIYIYQGLVFFT